MFLDNKKKLLSIICVVLNSKHAFEKTIDSVREQDLSNVEVIVVDGNSIDGTIDEISKNQDIINEFISESDSGIYQAMNKGIKISNSHFLHFLNAGDIFFSKDSLENLKKILNDSPQQLLKFQYVIDNKVKTEKLSWLFLSRRMMNHQSMIYHTSLFSDYLFDENLSFASDYKHLINILPNLKIKYFMHPLIIFDTNFSSSDRKNISIIWKERSKILLESSNLNFFYKYSVGYLSFFMSIFRKFFY